MAQPNEIRPWYRQFWPWFLMALPASAVVGGIATFLIAMYTPDGLVVDDYYKEGLAINRVLERDRAAERLGLQASVQFGEDGAVRVIVQSREAAEIGMLTLRLLHPTLAAQDVAFTLQRGQDGAFYGKIGPLAAGNWHVVLEQAGAPGWRLTGRILLPQERLARLG